MTNILKGDSSAEITLAVAQGCDYSGKTLHVEYQGARRSFFGVAAGGTVSFAFSAKETASMSLGAYPVRVWFRGEDGSIATIHNGAVKLRVTDCVADVRSDEAMYLDVRGGLHGLEGLPDRWNEHDLKEKIDEIIRRLGGTVAMLLACALPAFGAGPLTVQTAPKGEVYNDQPVVTNVTFDASGLVLGNYAAVSNAAMSAATQNDVDISIGMFQQHLETGEVTVNSASQAGWASEADVALMLGYFGPSDDPDYMYPRYGQNIMRQLDAATETNAQQTAALAAKVSAGQVTNIVHDLSLGGIWDSTLQIWWTPRMVNGSLTYHATTNVNMNAED